MNINQVNAWWLWQQFTNTIYWALLSLCCTFTTCNLISMIQLLISCNKIYKHHPTVIILYYKQVKLLTGVNRRCRDDANMLPFKRMYSSVTYKYSLLIITTLGFMTTIYAVPKNFGCSILIWRALVNLLNIMILAGFFF